MCYAYPVMEKNRDWRRDKREITHYIKNELLSELKKDQLRCKILTETDLHTCVYSHIDDFFSRKHYENWFILNEPYLALKKDKKKKPDLVICRRKNNGDIHPFILIELKERRSFSFKGHKTPLDSDTRKLIQLLKENKKKPNSQRNAIVKNYLILAITTDNTDKSHRNNPSDIKKELEERIRTELKKNKMSPALINVIIVNAFYSNKFKTKLQALEKIRKLRDIRLK